MISDDTSFTTASGYPRSRRGKGGWAVAVVAFLIGIGATLAALYYAAPRFGWRTALSAQPVAQPTPTARPAPAPALPALAVLSAREATLEAQIGELETRVAAIDGSARNAGAYAARAENMMVIVAARRALDRGRPLDYLENQLRQRFGATRGDAVRTLIAAARTPVTLDDLRGGLDAAGNQLIAGPSGENWWRTIRREAAQLIVIRQGTTPTSRPIDRLDRARRRLDTGQVEMALAEIERMPGAANAADWTASARRYIDARKALIDLETAALDTPLPPPPAAVQAQPAPVAPAPQPTPDPLAPTL
ncbi:hypothetical protein [Sphingomonas sp. VNH70]|uniref:hypothetical protein n=1 Tax=Sphingomonas silueang TaxID=3156617 RepID=UPI0032B50DC2